MSLCAILQPIPLRLVLVLAPARVSNSVLSPCPVPPASFSVSAAFDSNPSDAPEFCPIPPCPTPAGSPPGDDGGALVRGCAAACKNAKGEEKDGNGKGRKGGGMRRVPAHDVMRGMHALQAVLDFTFMLAIMWVLALSSCFFRLTESSALPPSLCGCLPALRSFRSTQRVYRLATSSLSFYLSLLPAPRRSASLRPLHAAHLMAHPLCAPSQAHCSFTLFLASTFQATFILALVLGLGIGEALFGRYAAALSDAATSSRGGAVSIHRGTL
ncbi:hypothetical protein FB451DRAFT_1396428 [Mycena latifolia]|nr:hypothetical protein FB451DRAFT_1396428 [Mycena latifolia]